MVEDDPEAAAGAVGAVNSRVLLSSKHRSKEV